MSLPTVAYNEAALDFVASGDNTIIPGVTGMFVKVYKLWFVTNGSVNVIFKDGLGALTGPVPLNGSFVLDDTNTIPWFTTAIGTGFIINLSTAMQISGRIYYRREVA